MARRRSGNRKEAAGLSVTAIPTPAPPREGIDHYAEDSERHAALSSVIGKDHHDTPRRRSKSTDYECHQEGAHHECHLRGTRCSVSLRIS